MGGAGVIKQGPSRVQTLYSGIWSPWSRGQSVVGDNSHLTSILVRRITCLHAIHPASFRRDGWLLPWCRAFLINTKTLVPTFRVLLSDSFDSSGVIWGRQERAPLSAKPEIALTAIISDLIRNHCPLSDLPFRLRSILRDVDLM